MIAHDGPSQPTLVKSSSGSDPATLQQGAETIAEGAMRQNNGPAALPPTVPSVTPLPPAVPARHALAMAAHVALLEQYMVRLVEAGLEAQEQQDGRSIAIFEEDFPRIANLVKALVEGAYLDTACRLADLSYSGVRAWLKAADEGDSRYQHIGQLVRAAEAIAEHEAVVLVRTAGHDARFWAAPATWLERKFPQKYGRRQEDDNAPRVVVQIGGNVNDVKVLVQAQTGPSRPELMPAKKELP